MPDLFDVLSRDHQEVQRMLTELEIGPTAATGSSGPHPNTPASRAEGDRARGWRGGPGA